MIKIPGRIPILIHPTFWILCVLIGFINGGGNFISMLIWVGVIFVSVLFHEFGHALTALMFGRNPRIELVALGGVTYHDSSKLSYWKQFLITLGGPLFGFLLALIATFFLMMPGLIQNPYALGILKWFQVVNIFWTVFNLLPVVPLDGGQLLRIVLEGFFGTKGIRYALLASTIIAVGISLVLFLFQSFLIGAFFFLFAYKGYESWRQAKMMSATDANESLRESFEAGEKALEEGKKNEAFLLFQKVRNEARKGLLYNLSSQYLAFLNYESGKVQEAYDLLYPLRKNLNEEALALLHRLAFELKNYPFVADVAGQVFPFSPTVETAMRNAIACASLKQVEPAVGWLETAHQEGLKNIQEVLKEPDFDPIRSAPLFQALVRSLK